MVILIAGSCNEKIFTYNVNCDECYYPEPDSADLVIKVTINDRFDAVPLVIFKGNVEDNNIEYVDTAYASPHYVWVRVDQKYAVRAKYEKSNANLFVVDGTKLKSSLVKDECEGGECYIIEDEDIDVSIKDEFTNF